MLRAYKWCFAGYQILYFETILIDFVRFFVTIAELMSIVIQFSYDYWRKRFQELAHSAVRLERLPSVAKFIEIRWKMKQKRWKMRLLQQNFYYKNGILQKIGD